MFADVPADAYYAKAVQWAYEQKITGGTGANTYSPDDPYYPSADDNLPVPLLR